MTKQEIIEAGGRPAGFCDDLGKDMGYFNDTCAANGCKGYTLKGNSKRKDLSQVCGNCKHWTFAGFGEY